MIEEMGDDYWGGNFNDVIWPKAESMGHSPIGCSDCHDPETMDLRITRPSFTKGMEAQGIDISKATKNDMRNYVCAQCHVEYHFAAENSEVTFPWNNGFKPEEMYEYYETTAGTWPEPSSEVAIKTNWKEDLYVVLSSWESKEKVTFVVKINPFVSWIWAGGILMMIGTAIALIGGKTLSFLRVNGRQAGVDI